VATVASSSARRRFRPGRALRYLVLSAGAVLFVAPFVYMVSSSFQPLSEIFSYPPRWFPTNPTLDNYRQFFGSGHQIGRWIINSVITTGAITVAQLFFSSLMAYTFAKRRFPGRDLLFFLMLATLMPPVQVSVIPNYLILKVIPLAGGNDLMGSAGTGGSTPTGASSCPTSSAPSGSSCSVST
jgi:multiple sugar transport system permease protein